jgi:26S proteasome regulatory subunit N12
VVHGCRDEIADCSERAYNTLSISDAKKLMLFKSDKEAEAYAAEVIAVSVLMHVVLLFQVCRLSSTCRSSEGLAALRFAERLGCAGWSYSLPGQR